MSCELAVLLFAQAESIELKVAEQKGFVVEGRARLPDGSILSVEVFRDAPGDHPAAWYGVTRIEGGLFRCEVDLFKEKNIRGRYRFRARFEPDLQKPEHQKLKPASGEARLVLGTDEEIQAEILRWARRVELEMGEMAALLEENRARFGRGRDPALWSKHVAAMNDRLTEIVKRNSDLPEFRFLGWTAVVHGQFERLRSLATTCADCWTRALKTPTESEIWESAARAALDTFGHVRETVRAAVGLGGGFRVDVPRAIADLAANVAQVVEAFEESLKDGRRRAELPGFVENRRVLFRILREDLMEAPTSAERDRALALARDFFDYAAGIVENPDEAAMQKLRESASGLKNALEILAEKSR